jgi:hypothetical protein
MGLCRQRIGGLRQEILTWFDAQGMAYPTTHEIVAQTQAQLEIAHQRAESEYQRAEQLRQYLRSLGVDPDQLP